MKAGHDLQDSDEPPAVTCLHPAHRLWARPAGCRSGPRGRRTWPACSPETWRHVCTSPLWPPVTSDSRYDFSCQAAGRKENVIYSQMQPAEAHTWLLGAGAHLGQVVAGLAAWVRPPLGPVRLTVRGSGTWKCSYYF